MSKIKIEKRTKRYLSTLVTDNMRSNTMFTSVDIANQAKKDGHRVRNFQVADWLRRNVIPISYDNVFLYNQELVTVDSRAVGMTLAYLYLPHGVDSSVYLDRDQNPQSFKQKDKKIKSKVKDRATGVKSKVMTKRNVTDNDGWKTQKRDAKGRWI